jgi:hypothetical protein
VQIIDDYCLQLALYLAGQPKLAIDLIDICSIES